MKDLKSPAPLAPASLSAGVLWRRSGGSSGFPSDLPPSGSVLRHPPSLHRVPRDRFPDFPGTYAGVLTPDRPIRKDSVSFVPPLLVPHAETTGPPRFLDNPSADMPWPLDPGGTSSPGPIRRDAAFRNLVRRRLPQRVISGLNPTACSLPVYASRPALPTSSRNTRFRLPASFAG